MLNVESNETNRNNIARNSGTIYLFVLPVPLLYLLHQLISGKLPSDHHDQVLNDIFSTVYIQQTAYHHR